MALADNALTTLATVKTELGISGSGEDDRLERLINAASDLIERYCDRSFYRDTATVESVAASGTNEITVNRLPINSITSITEGGEAVSSSSYEIHDADAGIILSTGGGWGWSPLEANDPARSPLPGTERKRLQVTYDGGWYTPKQEDDAAGTRALPYDIEQACIDLVRDVYNRPDTAIKSEKIGSWAATYAASGRIPDAVKKMLNPYRLLDF